VAQDSVDPQANNVTRRRDDIAVQWRWNLADIYQSWDEWREACRELERCIEAYGAKQGTLAQGADSLLEVMQLGDELGQLCTRVYFYPALMYDQNQRDNEINARRQEAAMLHARATQASSWFNPELLAIPLERVQQWMKDNATLAQYDFALQEVYRQQEHVLDEGGERLLSLGSRFQSSPGEAYAALTTADARFPKVTLQDGDEVTVTYGRYRAILAENRDQRDREAAFRALYGLYEQQINTHASLCAAVVERDWFLARARGYGSCLEAALHGNNIPVEVVETLIETTRAGTDPLRRYHRLRRERLGLDRYLLFDGAIPLVELDRKYPYEQARDWVIESVAPLGTDYQNEVRQAFEQRWIDVYENEGKRSGAYSAPVYGVHPYMLLNFNGTLDDVFTLAHEMGHSIHTLLSHRHQPYVYSGYTIFVAEVASTLNEALLLDALLGRCNSPLEQAVLLQRAIDAICGTFYTQVMFADWELQAHRQLERGEPLTADNLSSLYASLLQTYYGDVVDRDPLYARTWARIPHFFRTPFYVYQYATCFASSAQLLRRFESGGTEREGAVSDYLRLLRAGGSAHPMDLLRQAGVDLTRRATIAAVTEQIGRLVDRLEAALAAC
jgi:oligoendopeptidase F